MHLHQIIIENYRAFNGRHEVDLDDLTAIVGRNDVGKTSVFDALGVFFGDKGCKYDPQDKCVYADESADVRIGCVFSEFPDSLSLDATSATTLGGEYLLNKEGQLELHRVFKKGKGSGVIVARCIHPSASGIKGILQKKHDELKTIAEKKGVADVDRRSNAALRSAIYATASHLKLKETDVPLGKEGGKEIWEQLAEHLPIYRIFRADRPSTDDEAEVQDPMKVAVAHALSEVDELLVEVKDKVKKATLDLAGETLAHLSSMDPSLAKELTPEFKADPKWDSIFKLSLNGDDGIPINKRGSGVRRLVLISFFKAECDRLRRQASGRGIIYAVEEPETSQHPDKQRLLVETFQQMSGEESCQLILTTHVPGLAGQIQVGSIRHITRDRSGEIQVNRGAEDVYEAIAKDLGVLPDNRVQAFVCVEGPHDVSFFTGLCKQLLLEGITVPDFENDPRVVLLPLGGSTLKQWVNEHYLRDLGKPEYHIYDRDTETPPKYQEDVDRVNARSDSSSARLTQRRELENYLHPDAISESLGVTVCFSPTDDVPKMVGDAGGWNDRTAKKKLNVLSVAKMNSTRLGNSDPDGEVIGWLSEILGLLS